MFCNPHPCDFNTEINICRDSWIVDGLGEFIVILPAALGGIINGLCIISDMNRTNGTSSKSVKLNCTKPEARMARAASIRNLSSCSPNTFAIAVDGIDKKHTNENMNTRNVISNDFFIVLTSLYLYGKRETSHSYFK